MSLYGVCLEMFKVNCTTLSVRWIPYREITVLKFSGLKLLYFTFPDSDSYFLEILLSVVSWRQPLLQHRWWEITVQRWALWSLYLSLTNHFLLELGYILVSVPVKNKQSDMILTKIAQLATWIELWPSIQLPSYHLIIINKYDKLQFWCLVSVSWLSNS